MSTPFLARVLVCVAAALVCLPPSLHAQPAATGVIEGRVFNAATGSALANARVSLDGAPATAAAREVITD
ncbi:MAG: hypothetical protein RLZZ15_1687, partial [Verrucomicrobiota bacterium]